MSGFHWPVRVYYEDTDAGGVVYYANYLRFMERARTEWLRQLGFEQDALRNDPGILFAVREVALRFLAPARFNDALLVECGIADLSGARIVFDQRVIAAADVSRSLCEGRIEVVCLDAQGFRPRRLPDSLLTRLNDARIR